MGKCSRGVLCLGPCVMKLTHLSRVSQSNRGGGQGGGDYGQQGPQHPGMDPNSQQGMYGAGYGQQGWGQQ